MFLKCRPSTEHQNDQHTANGLFGEKAEDGRGMEWDSELAELRVTFSRSCNYLIWTLDAQLILKRLWEKNFLSINHYDRKLNVLLTPPKLKCTQTFPALLWCAARQMKDWEALKNSRKMMKARGQTATWPLTDQPHEVSQTNGAENRRIMSLLSLD